MSGSARSVLGLDVGARQIGVAVLRDEELVFYAVKTIKHNSKAATLRRLQKVLTILVAKYDIEIIALEKIIYPQQQNAFVKIVYEEIIEFGAKKKIRLFEFNPEFTRRTICRNKKPVKRRTALILTQRYTELARYYSVPKPWQKRYFAQLFDAIAVGLVCALKLKAANPLSVQSLINQEKENKNEIE